MDTRSTANAAPAAVSLETAGLSRLAQRGTRSPAWLDTTGEHQQGEVRMTTSATWPTRKNTVASAGDDYAGRPAPPGQELPEHELAHQVIGEMADLLRDIRGSMITDGCLLGAITIGFAMEAGLSSRALRPSAGRVHQPRPARRDCLLLAGSRLPAGQGKQAGAEHGQRAPVGNRSPARPATGLGDPAAGGRRSGGMDLEPRVPAARGSAPGQVPHAVRGHVDLLHRRLLPGVDRDHRCQPVTGAPAGNDDRRANLSAAAGWLIVRIKATMTHLSPYGVFRR
jgi:hypothetical protein